MLRYTRIRPRGPGRARVSAETGAARGRAPRRGRGARGLEPGAEVGRGPEHPVLGRRIDDADDRPATDAQADHDREALAPGDEVARAVDRIDEPHPLGAEPGQIVVRLLADHRV